MNGDSVTPGREFEGADLAEALRAASESLGMPAEAFRYSIVDEGRRGLFGFGVRRVRIRVLPEPQTGLDPVPVPREPVADPRDPVERTDGAADVIETVREMLRLMGLDLHAEGETGDGTIRVVLDGGDRKLLTQREGELLSSLQFLLNRMARRAWPDAGHVVVECEGFHDRREDDVVALAREVAHQVSRSGRPKKLHSMNPYERRLVHLTVREFPDLTSRSTGEGFLKQVTVAPAAGRGRD